MNESAEHFKITFCLNPAYNEQQKPVYSLKIQGGEYWELNILINYEELESIASVKDARFNEESPLKIGKCLGSPTFWSCENENLSILVGKDNETWEFGVNIKEEFLKHLLEEIKNAQKYVAQNGKWLY